MKKFDYIVIQAPMISELGLKGNSLLLFAMIHGFSKDGKNRFRASLEDMSEWLVTSKAAVSSTLKALEKSGYITKHDVKDGNIDKPEYSTNYEALMAKVEAEGSLKINRIYAEKSQGVLNQYPSKKRANSRGTESVPVLNQLQRGTETIPNGGTETVPNKYINIYKYYSCCYSELSEAQKQEEEKQFFKIFFFRGAADPAAEVKRFVGHNQANGWRNKMGAEYDSTQKRLGLADLWAFKTGIREGRDFIKFWEKVYRAVESHEGSEILIDPKVKCTFTADTMNLHCSRNAAMFIESHITLVKGIFKEFAAGRKIQYSTYF